MGEAAEAADPGGELARKRAWEDLEFSGSIVRLPSPGAQSGRRILVELEPGLSNKEAHSVLERMARLNPQARVVVRAHGEVPPPPDAGPPG